jgi:hypothetical protein
MIYKVFFKDIFLLETEEPPQQKFLKSLVQYETKSSDFIIQTVNDKKNDNN